MSVACKQNMCPFWRIYPLGWLNDTFQHVCWRHAWLQLKPRKARQGCIPRESQFPSDHRALEKPYRAFRALLWMKRPYNTWNQAILQQAQFHVTKIDFRGMKGLPSFAAISLLTVSGHRGVFSCWLEALVSSKTILFSQESLNFIKSMGFPLTNQIQSLRQECLASSLHHVTSLPSHAIPRVSNLPNSCTWSIVLWSLFLWQPVPIGKDSVLQKRSLSHAMTPPGACWCPLAASGASPFPPVPLWYLDQILCLSLQSHLSVPRTSPSEPLVVSPQGLKRTETFPPLQRWLRWLLALWQSICSQ